MNPFMTRLLEAFHPIFQKDTTFTKIFVGGLPYHSTDASLRRHFDAFGDIEEAVVITDKMTGKSRGYGFVTMVDRRAAERACNDSKPFIDGRKANVNLAYLGAKPRNRQTGLSLSVHRIHPSFVHRHYGLAQPYMYPQQSFLQHRVVVSSQGASASPHYHDYNGTHFQYTSAAHAQYPYSAPPEYTGYANTPSPTAHTPVPRSLPTSNDVASNFLHYSDPPDRLL